MDLFNSCLQLAVQFDAQLTATPRFWELDAAVAALTQTHAQFHQYAVFLCTVAGKLADRGFQETQLAAFVLRVNFNGFYGAPESAAGAGRP